MRLNETRHTGGLSRAAVTVMELTVAIAVLAALLATSMKMMSVASTQVRANERRLVAIQAAQSICEQIENMPWENLTSEAASQVPIPEPAGSVLPGAELKVAVHDESDPIAKRISIDLTWMRSDAQRAVPVRLTGWAFPENPSSP